MATPGSLLPTSGPHCAFSLQETFQGLGPLTARQSSRSSQSRRLCFQLCARLIHKPQPLAARALNPRAAPRTDMGLPGWVPSSLPLPKCMGGLALTQQRDDGFLSLGRCGRHVRVHRAPPKPKDRPHPFPACKSRLLPVLRPLPFPEHGPRPFLKAPPLVRSPLSCFLSFWLDGTQLMGTFFAESSKKLEEAEEAGKDVRKNWAGPSVPLLCFLLCCLGMGRCLPAPPWIPSFVDSPGPKAPSPAPREKRGVRVAQARKVRNKKKPLLLYWPL